MINKKRPLLGNAGFTIVEMLIVVAILGIGAAVSVWSVNRLLPDLRLKAAARDLKSDMQLMRLRAIRANTPVTLVLDTANENYSIFFDDNADWAVTTGEEVIKTVSMPGYVFLDDSTSFPDGTNTPQVRFNALGMPSDSGIVVMTNTLNSQRILTCTGVAQVSITGTTGTGPGGGGGPGGGSGPSGP